jgi:HK97 family phage major capsid protein
MPTLNYSEAVDRLAARTAEWRAIMEVYGPKVSGPSFGHLISDRDCARAWRLRDEIAGLTRYTRALERSGETTSSSSDFDRDSLRAPDSIEDGRFRDCWDLSGLRVYRGEPGRVAAELRSRALAAVEKMSGCSDAIRSASTILIEKFDSQDSRLARQCLVTSRPAYVRCWSKLMTGKEHALTQDEQRARRDVDAFRAMSLVDTTGGYLVPWQLEPSLVITSPFVRSDLRSAARVVIATGDVWNGASSVNVQYSFQSEGAETQDNSPPLGQPSVPTWTARGFIPISLEAMSDMENVAQEIGRLLAGGKLDLEGNKLIVGSGVGEPTGIVTSLSQSSNSSSVVTSGATGTFTLGDLAALQAALPPHYRAAASWLGNNLVYSKIRAFDLAGGSQFWTNLSGDRPPQLYARDALEAEAMSGVVASGNKVLVFGDLQGYVICDRLGVTTELIPMLPGPHERPSGQRGFFSWFRIGGDVINSTGLRCLSIQ